MAVFESISTFRLIDSLNFPTWGSFDSTVGTQTDPKHFENSLDVKCEDEITEIRLFASNSTEDLGERGNLFSNGSDLFT